MTKEQIIHMMCLTARHDYDIIKEESSEDILSSGMYPHQREALYKEMEQIFANCIEPYMTFK